MADSTLFSGQQFLNNLQAADHHRKRRFVMVGSFSLVAVILIFWIVSPFLFQSGTARAEDKVEPDFSLWQTVKSGSMLMTQNVIGTFNSFAGSLKVSEKSYVITPTATQ